MFPLHNNKTGQIVPVLMLDYGLVPVAAVATPTVEISKNGGTFAAPNDGTWAEVSDGWYTVTLDSDDSDTIGSLVVRVVKAAVAAETDVLCAVGIDPAEEVGMSTRLRRLHHKGVTR